MKKKPGSQAQLKQKVLEQDLCTGCGACIGLCPYQVTHQDRTVQLFDCDLEEGKCFAFCPRTPADYQKIRNILYDSEDITPEIGVVKGYFLTRAADKRLRARAQHGGTVTALLELAMSEGLISSSIISSWNEDQHIEGKVVENKDCLRDFAKSRFMASPTIAAFNRFKGAYMHKTGIVATPCQALSLAKMKTSEFAGIPNTVFPVLVIGLFCGWTLARDRFENLLEKYGFGIKEIQGMDVPAGKKNLELASERGQVDIPMVEVETCVRAACRYCIDSTAEFADLSVGAARFGKDSEEMRCWNQVVVRSELGKVLMDMALNKGVLEFRDVPAQALRNLKNAAAEKKKNALKKIIEKSGSAKNLLYLKSDDPVIKYYLQSQRKRKGIS